jgi:GT2 family glycosyltransferase
VGIAIGQLGILPDQSAVLVLELIPYILTCSKNAWRYPYKMPGTCAAIYRLNAAKEIGGFDEDIKGTGEDVDFAIRMMQSGWQIEQGCSVFYETHGITSLRQLWGKYVNNGYHGRRLYGKKKFVSFYKINPLSSFIAGSLYSIDALRITNRKISLLLPFHFFFKMTAWLYGFSTRKISNKPS